MGKQYIIPQFQYLIIITNKFWTLWHMAQVIEMHQCVWTLG